CTTASTAPATSHCGWATYSARAKIPTERPEWSPYSAATSPHTARPRSSATANRPATTSTSATSSTLSSPPAPTPDRWQCSISEPLPAPRSSNYSPQSTPPPGPLSPPDSRHHETANGGTAPSTRHWPPRNSTGTQQPPLP